MEKTPHPGGRPRRGPKRNLRAGAVWDQAATVAAGRGETMTDLVIRAIEAELKRLGHEPVRD
jgi:hypothetical protein